MASGNVLTDAGGRHAPAQDTDVTTLKGKLILNQGAEDDAILQMKSSDVAHGVTGVAETDTYGLVRKAVAAEGGLAIQGLGESQYGLFLEGTVTTGDTTKGTTALANVYVNATKKSGTSAGTPGANENLMAVAANSVVRFIMDADGDSHQDVGTAWTNFDIFDDVAVLNTLAAHVTRQDDPLRQGFREWLEQPESRRVLEKYRLVTFNKDGHHFVNMSRLTMLLVGAVRQTSEILSLMRDDMQTMRVWIESMGRQMKALKAARA